MNQYVQTPLLDRFEAKYIPAPNSGCWLWLGAVAGRGYGVLYAGGSRYAKGRQRYAHIVSYTLHKGPVPKGGVVRHICDSPFCVNPDHLLVGTQADNVNDAFARGRIQRGARHPNAKITAEQRRAIIADPRSSYEVARDYGFSARHIRKIRRDGK